MPTYLSAKKLPGQRSLEPSEDLGRSPLMYNLCAIKIGMELIRMKYKGWNNETLLQFSNIDKAITEMIDETFEIMERQEFTN